MRGEGEGGKVVRHTSSLRFIILGCTFSVLLCHFSFEFERPSQNDVRRSQ